MLTTSIDQPNAPESVLWADDHLKLFVVCTDGQAVYRVRLDQRRAHKEVIGPRWIGLFFGQSSRIRPYIKGRRLWRDRQLVLQCYGRKPRSYFVVAR